MARKDVLAILTSPAEEGAIALSECVARTWNARLTALYLARQPEPIIGDPAYTATLWSEVIRQNQETAAADFSALKQRLERVSAELDVRREDVFLGTIESAASRHAMQADLTIMQSPSNVHEDAAFEGALFRSGHPVLLAPPVWRGETVGKRIVIGWKAKREAARAIADAEAFLAAAEQVTLVAIDEDKNAQPTARDICAHLARKGVKAELRTLASGGKPAETVLLNEATALGADLIVMGGYGHSRFREFVFGGVTRSLSRAAPLPVLMSH